MQEITLHCGDSREVLSTMGDDTVDLVLTSPPYNMNLRIRNGKYCSRQLVKEISTKYDGFDDNLPMEQYYQFNKEIIDHLLRISKGPVFYNVQFLTGNKPALFRLIGEYADKLKEFIVWDKGHAQPAIGEGVLNSQFEVVLVFDKNDAISRRFKVNNFNRGTLSNLWKIPRAKKENRDHGAVFPIELADKVIKNFSPSNGIVLDPFMGTGTSGVSAKKNGRSYVGIELLDKYYKYSEEQINLTSKIDDDLFNQFFRS